MVASGTTRADASIPRTTFAAAGCLLISLATLPIWGGFGLAITDLGLADDHVAIAVIVGALAVPIALFQVLVTARGFAFSILEVVAHLSASSGPYLVRWFLSQPTEGAKGQRFFEEWSDLLALTPLLALAIVGATRVPLRQLCYATMIAAAPIYLGVALSDFIGGSGVKSIIWPARVWSEFSRKQETADRSHGGGT